jgi:hypothetical protein
MTDARFPERWLIDRRFSRSRLSGDQFRGYMGMLAWSVSNETDGVVTEADLPEMIQWLDPNDMPVFVTVGLCAPLANGWLIIDFEDTQTSRDELQALKKIRKSGRDRQAKRRAAKADKQDQSRDASRDGHADSHVMSRDKRRDCTGEARQGKDRQGRLDEKEIKGARAQKPAPHNNHETFAEYQARAHQDVDPAEWEQAISAKVRDMYDR